MKLLVIGSIPISAELTEGGVQVATCSFIKLISKFSDLELKVLSFNTTIQKKATSCLENICIEHYPFNLKSLFSSLEIVRTTYNSFNPDLIHLHGTGFLNLLTMWIPRKKLIVTVHGILKNEIKYGMKVLSIKWAIKYFIEYIYIKRYRNFLLISKNTLNELFPRESLRFLNYSIIGNIIPYIFFKGEIRFDYSKLKICYIGAIYSLKNIHLLLNAILELQKCNIPVELKIIGPIKDISYFNDLHEYVLKQSLPVVFLGPKNRNEIVENLESCNIFCLPSLQENLPVSIGEAMAMGKLVVASNVGGIPEMIQNGATGFLFNPQNLQEIITVFKGIWSNFQNLACIGRNAQEFAYKNYSEEYMSQKVYNFYNGILSQR